MTLSVLHTHTHTHTYLITDKYFVVLKQVAAIVGVKLYTIERKSIKEVYTRLKGTAITANQMKKIEDGKGEVRVFAGGKTAIFTKEEKIENANINDRPSVIVQSRGLIDVIYYAEKFTFKNEMWAYTHNDVIRVKYLYYILKNNIQNFRDIASSTGSFPQISLGVTEDFKILFPPLPVQQHVVDILDKFETLVNDVKEGLPHEIELRQKEYEYYREQLFNFKQ